MAKLNLIGVGNLQNENSATLQINSNSSQIESAFSNTLSRDGTSPNEMESSLDMNSNPILNLPAAASGTEPVRKAEFDRYLTQVSNGVDILDGSITNTKLSPMAAYTVKGRLAGQSDPQDITLASLTAAMGLESTATSISSITIPSTVSYIRTAGYHTVGDGGGALYKRNSSVPDHTAYLQSLDGVYWELAEGEPNFDQFGAFPYSLSDSTPALNRFISYSDNTSVQSLRVPAKSYTLGSRPWPITRATSFIGQGAYVTGLLVNYLDDGQHGTFQKLPTSTGGGLTLKGMTLTHGLTGNTGTAVFLMSGRCNPIDFSGSVSAGDNVTITINFGGTDYFASYTASAGDTLSNIPSELEFAINSNTTVYNAGFQAVAKDKTLYVIAPWSTVLASTVNVTNSTGGITFTQGTPGDYNTSYNHLDNLVITSAQGWFRTLYIDGTKTSGSGTRDTWVSNCIFFGGGSTGTVILNGCVGGNFINCNTASAGGISGDVVVTGSSTVPSQAVHWSNSGIGGDLVLDYARNCNFSGVNISDNITNTGNTTSVTGSGLVGTSVPGTVAVNWVSSSWRHTDGTLLNVTPKTYTVASLPSSANTGQLAFATNGRMFDGAGALEGAGTGTGGLVSWNGSAWKIIGTDQTVQA